MPIRSLLLLLQVYLSVSFDTWYVSTGEGINSALEDVAVLTATLLAGDRATWLARYNAARIAAQILKSPKP